MITSKCEEFFEGSCSISDGNTVGFLHSSEAGECQEECRLVAECEVFTWYDGQCYLLSSCGPHLPCPCCVRYGDLLTSSSS